MIVARALFQEFWASREVLPVVDLHLSALSSSDDLLCHRKVSSVFIIDILVMEVGNRHVNSRSFCSEFFKILDGAFCVTNVVKAVISNRGEALNELRSPEHCRKSTKVRSLFTFCGRLVGNDPRANRTRRQEQVDIHVIWVILTREYVLILRKVF